MTTPKCNKTGLPKLAADATDRLLLAVAVKLLAECQLAVKDGDWIERNMDSKVNRLLNIRSRK
jgi:hypothetical protein